MSELRIVADMMALAARTAPKSVGKDFVVIRIIEGEAVKALAERMLAYGQQTGKKNFDRDGANVAASDVVVLIGIKDAQPLGLNCGACGVDICEMLPINTFDGRVSRPAVCLSAVGHGHCPGLRGENGQHTERRQPDHVSRRRGGAPNGLDRGRLRHGDSAVSDGEEHLL